MDNGVHPLPRGGESPSPPLSSPGCRGQSLHSHTLHACLWPPAGIPLWLPAAQQARPGRDLCPAGIHPHKCLATPAQSTGSVLGFEAPSPQSRCFFADRNYGQLFPEHFLLHSAILRILSHLKNAMRPSGREIKSLV